LTKYRTDEDRPLHIAPEVATRAEVHRTPNHIVLHVEHCPTVRLSLMFARSLSELLRRHVANDEDTYTPSRIQEPTP
jgi:hypothetical protein